MKPNPNIGMFNMIGDFSKNSMRPKNCQTLQPKIGGGRAH